MSNVGGDRAFLMEAIMKDITTYCQNRRSVLDRKAGSLSDAELRYEIGRYNAAKEIRESLTKYMT
jgi:hypothetical protein